jgi:PAS domain S-box-containing protein
MTSPEFRTGDAIVAFDGDLNVVSWNPAAEALTGVPADEAIGSPCWRVLGAVDLAGSIVCHPGCSSARLASEGWPVRCQHVLVRTRDGRREVSLSTVAIRNGGEPLYLHLLHDGARPRSESASQEPDCSLTPRQREVLRLIVDGVPAKVIASRLRISEATVRNHIRAILLELRCHSQLEAVATARRRGIVA